MGRLGLSVHEPVAIRAAFLTARAAPRRPARSRILRALARAAARLQSCSRGPIKRAFVVHGEAPALGAMADLLREEGVREVHVPEQGDTYTL